MGIEIKQDAGGPVEQAALVSDNEGGRVLHLAANARVPTTAMFFIDKTSPGSIQGLGANSLASIPGGAVPTGLRVFGKLVDANSSATITVGIDNVTSNHFLSGLLIGGAAVGSGQTTPNGATNMHTALPVMPVGEAHTIVGRYAVPVTSVGGGPWYVEIDYYLPDPA